LYSAVGKPLQNSRIKNCNLVVIKGTRVSWPLECGSLGNHYYEYVKDKPLQRGEVSNFLSNM